MKQPLYEKGMLSRSRGKRAVTPAERLSIRRLYGIIDFSRITIRYISSIEIKRRRRFILGFEATRNRARVGYILRLCAARDVPVSGRRVTGITCGCY